MVDIGVVVDKLHGFETADEIADFFRYRGIKAYPQEARSCAISQFVAEETGLAGHIVTTTRDLSVQEVVKGSQYEYYEELYCMEHSAAMVEFIRKFDTGAYPDLVADGFIYEPYPADCTCGCNN